MAAKKLAQAMGKDEEMLFAKKQSDDGTEVIYICPATYQDSVKVSSYEAAVSKGVKRLRKGVTSEDGDVNDG